MSGEDPRDDPFAPPEVPCECWCLHCERVFMSDRMWFQRVINDPDGFDGFWMCPTPNCDGKGFTFDIFPTDPEHPANEGWYSDDGEEGEEDDGEEGEHAWDPEEPNYVGLDDESDESDDIEGEEWKYGLAPGERPAEPEWIERGRRQWDEEQRKYDQPDERPRVLDWGDRESRRGPNGAGGFKDDDIPF